MEKKLVWILSRQLLQLLLCNPRPVSRKQLTPAPSFGRRPCYACSSFVLFRTWYRGFWQNISWPLPLLRRAFALFASFGDSSKKRQNKVVTTYRWTQRDVWMWLCKRFMSILKPLLRPAVVCFDEGRGLRWSFVAIQKVSVPFHALSFLRLKGSFGLIGPYGLRQLQ